MDLPDLMLALHAVREGDLDRADLPRVLSLLDTWRRGGLEVSCAQILARDFRIDPARVRRWEEKLSGRASRRIGKYQLIRRVGQGGMGIVFEAEDPNFKRRAALKILSPALGRDPEAIQGFLREVKSAGRFNHPNIVHAFDAGIDGDLPYLVMEFVDGENLFQLLQRAGPLEIGRAAAYLQEAARALSVLEAAGWIHGDGKPSNWIVSPQGPLKLADLGLCRPPGKPRAGETLFGSPPYIAPEHLRGDERIDIRADLYSLGATFHHLLTGRPPYEARSIQELRSAMARGAPPSIAASRADIPADLARIVDRLLDPDPARRHQTCADLLADLDRVCARLGVESWKTSHRAQRALDDPAQAASAPALRRRALWAATLLAAAALVAVIAVNIFGPTADAPKNGNDAAPPAAGSEAGARTDLGAASGWTRIWESEPRDYPAIFAWLESPAGSAGEDAAPRRALAESALAGEAAPLWRETERRIESELLPARRFHGALALLDAFPERLRVAEYRAHHDALLGSVRARREEHLAALRLRLRTANATEDALAARALFRDIAGADAADGDWLRSRLLEGSWERPWMEALERFARDEEIARRARRRSIEEQLAAGVIPPARLAGGVDFEVELALEFLGEHPHLIGDPSLLRLRLLEGGFLVALPEGLLGTLVALLEREASARAPAVRLEVEGARLLDEARAACERLDEPAAERAWQALARPELMGTAAARVLAATLESDRAALRWASALRGGAFVAEVTGDWLDRPRFRYRCATPGIFGEWRARRERWHQDDAGIAAKGRGLHSLENIIPFDGGVEVELAIAPPRGAWELYFLFDEQAVGLSHPGPGALNAISGALADVVKGLEAGAGAWPAAAAASDAAELEITIAIAPERLTLSVGGHTLTYPVLVAIRTGWVKLLVSEAVVLGVVALEGSPNRVWLEERSRLREAAKTPPR